MNKTYRQSILSIVFLYLLSPINLLHAEECKVEVKHITNPIRPPWESEQFEIESYTLRSNAPKSPDLKHMRKVWNEGDFDIKIDYWDGNIDGSTKSLSIFKGKSKPVSGDLKKIECLNSVEGRSISTGIRTCNLKGYFASGPLIPLHSTTEEYKISVGTTKSNGKARKQHLRKMVNTGIFDAEIEVKGLGPVAIWKPLHVGDDYIGQVDLQAIRCLSSNSPTQSFLEKLKNEIDDAVTVTRVITQDVADQISLVLNKGGSVKSAPSSCEFQSSGRDFYENRYMGSTANLGSQKKFDNLRLDDNYSLINNYLMMQASGKTYYDQIRYKHREAQTEIEFMCGVQELYDHWGFSKVQFVNTATSANAIIASNDKAVVIAIRGTQTPFIYGSSYVDDIKAVLDLGVNAGKKLIPASAFGLPSTGKVHLGYAVNSALLAIHIEKALDNITNIRNKKIYITGHSLGAATAIMLTSFLQTKSKYNITATYAYASPEVGNERFTRDLYRVTHFYLTNNYRDPIPNIGRKPFEHFGQVNNLESALYASREITLFKGDNEHKAIVLRDKHPSLDRKNVISQINGSPRPYAFFNDSFSRSPEWHFHTGNFYVAHTYEALLKSNFRKKSGTGIMPEFGKTKLCISEDRRTASMKNINWDGVAPFNQLHADKQQAEFIKCQ